MKEKIKNWWKTYITNQYAIKRSGFVYWFIYTNGEKKIRKVSGQTELLVSSPKVKEPLFEKSISKAKLLRGFIAHYYLRQYKEKYQGQYTFELVKEEGLLFLTDITGISGN